MKSLEYLVYLIMLKSHWFLSGIFLAGLIILMLPDKGSAIIRFNELHGPSFLDIAGLVLISISWVMGLIIIIKNWKGVKARFGKGNILLLVGTYALACSGIILALIMKNNNILWPSVVVALVVNILFVAFAFATREQV